jgi:hypothetical protein
MPVVAKTFRAVGKGYLVASSNVASSDVKFERSLSPGSKRGFWTFDDSETERVLTNVARSAAQKNVLSCAQSGDAVDLWTGDDGSGRQRWKFELAGGSGYYVSVENGLADPSAKYVVPHGTGVRLSSERTVWIVEDAHPGTVAVSTTAARALAVAK